MRYANQIRYDGAKSEEVIVQVSGMGPAMSMPAEKHDPSSLVTPKPYRVVNSFENDVRNRCVDIVLHPDGRFGFQEWRREPEDPGNWAMLTDDGGARSESEADAIAAARRRVPWFSAAEQRVP